MIVVKCITGHILFNDQRPDWVCENLLCIEKFNAQDF